MMDLDILVKVTNKGRSVFANRWFRKGETVVVGHRVEILPERTMHSFQMDFDLHIQLDEPGRLINHSCSPNTGVRNNKFGGYDFVALVDIPAGTEITWDYETTEYISIAVPECCFVKWLKLNQNLALRQLYIPLYTFKFFCSPTYHKLNY
ncbi:MAG: SET domain-containing protein [Anabaena sp. 49633_E8]|nr:SET domain-containing protein [Anabaena sp. 49633_E8]